jgi:hypothetical protein
MRSRVSKNEDAATRLAVIEEKLEMVLSEIATIREYIPVKMIEHAEKIAVLDRNARTLQWLGGVIAVAILGAFIGHVLGQ